MSEPAFIIGNGVSRRNLNLEDLRGQGPIFGCNGLYRTFTPDYLIAIDEDIVSEIEANKFTIPSYCEVIVPAEIETWEHPAYSKMIGYRRRSNAGFNAMFEALKRGHTHLICFGFDFLLNDRHTSVKNVFDGTPCYGPATRSTFQDNLNRIQYFIWIAEQWKNIASWSFGFPQKISPLDTETTDVKFHALPNENVKGFFFD